MDQRLKHWVKSGFSQLGIEIRRYPRGGAGAASASRPIGVLLAILQDLAARGFRPRGIVDAGAHRGEWTRLARLVYPDAHYLLIEPLEEVRPFLEQMAGPKLEYLGLGLGAAPARLRLSITDDPGGSSFLTPRDSHGIAGAREVEVVTLDSILRERPGFSPDLIKMDIQGYELEALRGASSAFPRCELFILETSLYEFWPGQPLARDVIAFMAERGFELYDLSDYLRRPLDGALGQIDLCFARADGVLRRHSRWE